MAPIYQTVYLGDTPVALIKQVRSGSGKNVTVATQLSYVYADHLDTPRVVVRASDHAVQWRWDGAEAFGATPPSANPSGLGVFKFNQRFPGQVFDAETGNFHNGWRDYRPDGGGYLQADPIGLAGGSWSLYAYVGGNPVSYVDPDGLQAISIPAPIAASIARPSAGTSVNPLVSPNTNPSDPNDGRESDKCRSLRKKVENLRNEVFEKRIPDLAANRGSLPLRIGPGEALRDTIRGHEKLLNRQWRRLNELEDKYFDECGC